VKAAISEPRFAALKHPKVHLHSARAKQLGEYAIPNKDAPCFDIISQ